MRHLALSLVLLVTTPAVAIAIATGCGQDVQTCATACALGAPPGTAGCPDGACAPAGGSCASTCGSDQATATAAGRGGDFQALLTCIGNAQTISQLCLPLACGLTDAFGTPTGCSAVGSGAGSTTSSSGASFTTTSSSLFTTGSSVIATTTSTSFTTSSSFTTSTSFTTSSSSGGTCDPPPGGLPCTPGVISCGTSSCDVPSQFRCDIPGTSETCQPAGLPCAGTPIACNEASDCADGEVCCLASASTSEATFSCQKLVGGKCPIAPVATAQICRSSTECASGTCQFWNCLGSVVEACTNPVPSLDLCQVSTVDGGRP